MTTRCEICGRVIRGHAAYSATVNGETRAPICGWCFEAIECDGLELEDE